MHKILLGFGGILLFSPLTVNANGNNDVQTLLLIQSDTTNGSTTFTDSSLEGGNTITSAGDVQHSTSESVFGASSIAFDGTGDYLTVSDPRLGFADGDFTIDLWAKIDGTGQQRLISFNDDQSTLVLGTNDTGNGKIALWGKDGWPGKVVGTTTIEDGVWHHIALVRNGDNVRIFVNGVLDMNFHLSTNFSFGGDRITFGHMYNSSDGYLLNGYLDEIRVSNIPRWPGTYFTPELASYGIPESDLPTGGTFSIQNNATSTNSVDVALTITCPNDATTPVFVAYGNATDPTNWTECTDSLPHQLTAGEGSKTAYVRFKDSLNNTTTSISDSITFANITSSLWNTTLNLISSSLGFSISDTNNIDRLNVDFEGNVGIGTATPAAKLDVNGEIKLANSGLNCNGSTEGILHYNSADKRIEYCDTSQWQSILLQ